MLKTKISYFWIEKMLVKTLGVKTQNVKYIISDTDLTADQFDYIHYILYPPCGSISHVLNNPELLVGFNCDKIPFIHWTSI